MDYKNIIVNIGKYHYLIVNSSKSIILSSSNSKSEARQNALDKLQPILNAVLGKHIYLLTIRKIPKKDLKSQENDSIKVLGGPIEVSIEKIEVINKNKLKNKGGFGNRRAYFTESFLKKNKEINRNSLEKFAFDYHNKKLKQGPFDVNVIN
jgi:hypothetical protein